MNKKIRKVLSYGYVILFIMTFIVIDITYWGVLKDTNTLCEDYANQEVTASRIGYGENQEREYSINGEWIPESKLIEDCLK